MRRDQVTGQLGQGVRIDLPKTRRTPRKHQPSNSTSLAALSSMFDTSAVPSIGDNCAASYRPCRTNQQRVRDASSAANEPLPDDVDDTGVAPADADDDENAMWSAWGDDESASCPVDIIADLEDNETQLEVETDVISELLDNHHATDHANVTGATTKATTTRVTRATASQSSQHSQPVPTTSPLPEPPTDTPPPLTCDSPVVTDIHPAHPPTQPHNQAIPSYSVSAITALNQVVTQQHTRTPYQDLPHGGFIYSGVQRLGRVTEWPAKAPRSRAIRCYVHPNCTKTWSLSKSPTIEAITAWLHTEPPPGTTHLSICPAK